MYWQYHIAYKNQKRKIDLSNDSYDYKEYGIVEVFYNEDGEIQFTSENFEIPYGESKEEVIECLEVMLEDARKNEVLDLDKLWKELAEDKENMWNELKESIKAIDSNKLKGDIDE